MMRNKCMVIVLLILIAISNLVEAADKNYVVSFVAGQTELGLVAVTQTDSGIQVGNSSITPMDKNMGSTAVLHLYHGWDGDFYFEVDVIHAGDGFFSPTPLAVGRFWFDTELNKIGELGLVSQIPGEYHPLQAFQTDSIYFLTTGAFGTPGANNYVSNPLYGGKKTKIFINPDNRSPGTAAVAPDGKMVSQMTFQGLNHIGLIGSLVKRNLVGLPIQWLNVNDFQGYSQSLSNPIESAGTRYLAYRNFQQPRTSNSRSKVMIQNVNAKTGQPQGTPRAITNFARAMDVDSEKLQSIAITPDGRLILYTGWNNDCKKQVLFAQKLVNGSSVGSRSVIIGCGKLQKYPVGVYGINLTSLSNLGLKERDEK